MLYCVGDIHGFTGQLDRTLQLIEADGGADAPIVFLGDYVDRGPNAKGTIQTLIDGQAAGRPWTCLIGNHDLMFWRFVTSGITQDAHILSNKGWLHHRLGGNTTLASYIDADDLQAATGMTNFATEGLDPTPTDALNSLKELAQNAVPKEHLDWIAAQPRFYQTHEHTFVHAGLRVGVPLSKQTEEDLTWIRDGWLDSDADHGNVVVHGHTALDFPQHHGNRVNLDSGAGYGRTLVPAVLDGGKWFTLHETGRTALTPTT
ncbi:serine/threonine protein phosphatase 1 [Octadecabacter temperatus]|uniref:Diadenosine tetraphosphatase n=1 Tax=Octadecabacter temperatus TaxID=1458307 RepID=A0A0K0Y117_9RHOB|nr:metallophosphoesterase [Octadecabacter temperatus]AKS44597.1 diadenosine tetraphosphatase [Octadecabacter temperatus]SIO37669.1 serine/threonine protein phosphatase 1 [Octadecabacter temperatus]